MCIRAMWRWLLARLSHWCCVCASEWAYVGNCILVSFAHLTFAYTIEKRVQIPQCQFVHCTHTHSLINCDCIGMHTPHHSEIVFSRWLFKPETHNFVYNVPQPSVFYFGSCSVLLCAAMPCTIRIAVQSNEFSINVKSIHEYIRVCVCVCVCGTVMSAYINGCNLWSFYLSRHHLHGRCLYMKR